MKTHPRIHPANRSLLRQLPEHHIACQALRIHAEARDTCVGKEIDWPHLNVSAIDQAWFSDLDFREWRFSMFAYQFISYDLVLDGWLESAPQPTEMELGFLEKVPTMRTLLRECESAARKERNSDVLPLVAKANEFVDALERAIVSRLESLGSAR
ncbi:MAG: hypothetical protein AB7O59_14020 [Pirellulales bacterium]